MHISLSAKKLYAKSRNQLGCLTSTAYLNLPSRRPTSSFRPSNPGIICIEGGNWIRRARVFSCNGSILLRNVYTSSLTSTRCLSCVIILGNLAVNLKLSGVFDPVSDHEFIGHS